MKCVLIIGGVNDIGKSIAREFLKREYAVVVGYHNHLIKEENIDYQKCDVTKEEDIKKIIEYCLNKYQRIDILLNLANINQDNSFLDKTKSEFMRVLEVNLVGTFLLNQCYSRYIDTGMIINMASTDGIDTGSIFSIDYSASKAGIITMSKIIANGTNNKVYCICPNWIDSATTNSINHDYLVSELKRIKQTRLITILELIDNLFQLIDGNYESGSVFRIDVKDNQVWMKKI